MRSKLMLFVLMAFGVQTFDTWLPVTASAAFATPSGADRESYLSRPSILTVSAQNHAELGASWPSLKKAHFAFVAQLLELYPDREIYFLARDSELLYDAAVLMATESTAKRIHLLNVSRGNMQDPHLKDYLAQNGISDFSLARGQKVLFVDTGFAGTIPATIQSHFPAHLHSQIKTHLIVSANAHHPSARSFLIEINPAANDTEARNMRLSIISYEQMPRSTHRSDRYEFIDEQWTPTSVATGPEDDGIVNKDVALKYAEDLKKAWQNPEVRKFSETISLATRHLKNVLNDVGLSEMEKRAQVLQFLRQPSGLNPGEREALVRDILDAQKNLGPLAQFTPLDLGLIPPDLHPDKLRVELAKKYPQWKPIIQNPKAGIPWLFAQQDWQTIGAFLDSLPDYEIRKLIFEQIGTGTFTQSKFDLLLSVIEGDNPHLLEFMNMAMDERDPALVRPLIKRLIELHGNNPGLKIWSRMFGFHMYGKAKALPDLVELLVKKMDASQQAPIKDLLINASLQSQLPELKTALHELLKKADRDVFDAFVKRAFHYFFSEDLLEICLDVAPQIHSEKGYQRLLEVRAERQGSILNGAYGATVPKPSPMSCNAVLGSSL